MPQSFESISAVWVAAISSMVATLQPRPYDRIIKRIAIVGPSSSTFKVYRGFVIDPAFILTQTRVGTNNTANLPNPITAFANETTRWVWSGGTTVLTSVASANIWYDWELSQ